RLRTPHVVRVHEHGLDGSTPFIGMELLEGEDVHTRLRREKRLSLDETVRIVAQTAKGLRAAHAAGIIHRDLKPQNIHLSIEDGEQVVKVLDFGVAKMTEELGEGTQEGVVVGSPHYMSPEQARGHETLDHRSDLWGLAGIAFRAITGHLAFSGKSAGDVAVKICSDPLPLPTHFAPDMPPELDGFFLKAFARERDDRYQSADDLARALAEAVRLASDSPSFPPSPSHPGALALPSDSGHPPPAPFGPAVLSDLGATPPPEDMHTPATGPSTAGVAGSVPPAQDPYGLDIDALAVAARRRRRAVIVVAVSVIGLVVAAGFAVVGVGIAPGDPATGPLTSPSARPIQSPGAQPLPDDSSPDELGAAGATGAPSSSESAAAPSASTAPESTGPRPPRRPPPDEWGY
ncbi:MAG: serine/threonine protein kinase, partial [Deltaproteobacteria bacterium]|nr:serine/threonine protein kinase [Deltaproteobacteria bacterium]